MSVDGAVLMSVAAALIPPGSELPPGVELRDVVSLSYVAEMPGRVTDSNGNNVHDSTVGWTLPYDGRLTMRAQSKLGEKGSTAWFIVAAIGALIAIAAISAGVGLVLLRRRRIAARRAAIHTSEGPIGPAQGSAAETLGEAGSELVRAVTRVVEGDQVADVVGQSVGEPPERSEEA